MIPAGVTVQVKDHVVTVKGPKGELSQEINPDIEVNVVDGHVEVTRPETSASTVPFTVFTAR